MSNYMEAAFLQHEARYQAQVLFDTFGHLEPKRRQIYPCTLIFTQSETGDYAVIRSDFGDDLGGSPGLYTEMYEWILEKAKEPGKIYKFIGNYMRFNNGRCRFSGKIRLLKV